MSRNQENLSRIAAESAFRITVNRWTGQVSWTGSQGWNSTHVRYVGSPSPAEVEEFVSAARAAGLTVRVRS